MPCPPLVTTRPTGGPDMSEKPVRRSRSRHAGSITSYATQSGQRWKFQIYVPKDPERPELGDTRLTRGGFKSLDEAQRVLAEALTKKKSNARFQAKAPPSASTPNTGSPGCGCRTPLSRATRRSSATTSRPTSAQSSSTSSPPPGSGPLPTARDLRPTRQARVGEAAVGQHRLQGPRPARRGARRRRR